MRFTLLLITFMESVGSILLERGIYFYTEYRAGYSPQQNLALALCFGAVYALGAMASHPIANRLGERWTLQLSLVGLALAHLLVAVHPTGPTLVTSFIAIGLLTGIKWPLIESYVVAGLTPRQTLRMVGRFNVTWAVAVPVTVSASGWITQSTAPWLLFVLPIAVHGLSLAMTARLARSPLHLPADHPERPPANRLERYRLLLASSRWAMLGAYSLLFLLVPLLPETFRRLGLAPGPAASAASLLDWMRAGTFLVMSLWAGWYGRALPVLLSVLALPLSSAMILFAPGLGVALGGELLFGVACGVVYYAALYYAMVVKNASVDAGGVHEGLIGSGFALGPAVGLLGHMLAAPMGGYVPGMVAGAAPLVLITTIAATRPMLRLWGRE